MYFKKMVGEQCYLSPIDIADAEKYTAWLNDLEVAYNLTLATANITLESEREILAKISKEHNYGIIDKKTDALIGNVGLIGISNLHRTAEVGIFIGDKSCWGKGYGTEALRLLIDYAFKVLNLNSIMLRVYSYNTRAIASYEKVGFKRVGEIREAHYFNMKYHNLVLMDILPGDFYAQTRP
jgi:RimJ/RimL family protein N-acetyltransferase